jgi:predicted metal-binding protein
VIFASLDYFAKLGNKVPPELQDIEIKKFFLGPVEVIYEPRVIGLCVKPYAGHPKGCPNFGKRSYCPPQTSRFPDVYEKEAHIVVVGLNFRKYLVMMRERHPNWTDRALRNQLYWQGYLRKHLVKYANEILKELGNEGEVVVNPEGMGINLTKTCVKVGLKLEWPPKNWVYKIALIGKRKQ